MAKLLDHVFDLAPALVFLALIVSAPAPFVVMF